MSWPTDDDDGDAGVNNLSLSGVRQVVLGSVKYFVKLKGRNYFYEL